MDNYRYFRFSPAPAKKYPPIPCGIRLSCRW